MSKLMNTNSGKTMSDKIRRPKGPQRFRPHIYGRALLDSVIKLNPAWMARSPVMFVVEIGSVLTTALWIRALIGFSEAPASFIGGITLWLWLTVIFANFSEALAEGQGKAQAAALRLAR